MGFSRSGRRALLSRRVMRLAVIVMFFSLSGVTAMGSADAAALPQTTVRFSSVAAFVKSLFADAVGLPQQASGTAAGKGGEVPAAATRAGRGSGRAPGKGVGEVAAYSPAAHKAAVGKSGTAHTGFDMKTSVRNARKSTAFSDWYDNADGSYTVKTAQSPVNYRTADGSWQPIDPTLALGADGRLHERANGVGVSFAGGSATVGAAGSGPRTDLASPRAVRSFDSSTPAASTGELVSLSLGGSDQVGWSLAGAASVNAVVSGATAEYDGILPDTNLALTSEDWGVKETFTLAGAAASNSWTFPLTLSGVSVRDDPTYGWELVDGTGAVVARVSVPFAYDSVVVNAQHPNTTFAVSYSLTTDASGAQSLVMTLDRSWLDDPARVFPVTVDPTVTVGDAGVRASTYIEWSESNVNNSSTGWLHVGYSDWSSPIVKARSFIYFDTMPVGSGYHVTQANLGIFDIWAATCTAEPFDVYPVTDSSWTGSSINMLQTWTDTTYTGPGGDASSQTSGVGPSMGEVSASPGAACTNINGDAATGTWMYPQLDVNIVNRWTSTNPNSYHGIEIAAPSESNDLEWKIFDSTAVSSNSPYIYITYTPDSAPQVNGTAPVSGYNSPTLTPVLRADASDPDDWPGQGLGYEYRVYDGANDQLVVDSQPGATCGGGAKPSAGSSWPVPAGKLKWGQSYYWAVVTCDGYAQSAWSASSALVTAVPPPLLTSGLSQNSSGHGFDPALGNYTTSVTDAQVAGAGPALAVTRAYNSLDPRTGQALGAGWSSLVDAQAAQQYDVSGADVLSVTVTYPDGSQVGFGRNFDGSFSAPLGRFATLAAVSGGYTLTDKNDTVYRFTHPTAAGSGIYRITSVTDAAGRVLEVRYSATTGGTATRLLSDTSGRSLFFTWTTPSGASGPHVQSVATDPVTSNGVTAPLTWKYYYQGDQLTGVCDPLHSASCSGVAADVSTKYGYQAGSQFRTAQLDGAPTAYWPLSEASGGTAGDLVPANEHYKDATYSATGVTYGTPGPLVGSTATAVSLDGVAGSVALPRNLVTGTTYLTVSLWFKTATTSSYGPLFCEQDAALPGTAGNATCSLYVGTDGYLHGQWYTGSTSQMVSTTKVNDTNWHHVVLAGADSTQQLYLDGSTQYITGGPLSGQINNLSQGYEYVGAGYNSGAWPATPGTAGNWFFHGALSDVAVYQSGLSAATVAQLNAAGTTAASMLQAVTRPSGNVAAQVSYSTVTGRVNKVVDGNGGAWILGAASVSGSAEGYRAAVMGSAPSGYWRLGDAVGSTVAYDEVAADGAAMTYYGTPTLGAGGPLNASQSAATFNGSSQYAATGGAVLDTTKSFSVSAWAKLASTSGFQDVVAQDASQATGFELQYDATDAAWAFSRATSDTAGAGSVKVHGSSKPSTGAWYHLVGVYDASKNTMSLYVNGQLAGSGTSVSPIASTAALAIGRGRYNGASTAFFNGSIAEVAVYPGVLDGATVAAMYAAGKDAAGLNPTVHVTVTDPANKTLTYEYDPVNGMRPIAQIDGTGAKTTYGYDIAGFLHTTVDPNGDETITGHDERGNTVSQSTCQNQAADACSTSYFTYYPSGNTGTVLPADPRNDMLLTASDGRSSGASDATYRTTYAYDQFGDRKSVTSPPVPGYPGGRTATTVYTDGTMTYPASDDASKPVPAGLLWTQTSAGGSVTQYHYYADGDLYSVISPTGGMTTTFTYDQLGRPTQKLETYTPGGPCPTVNGQPVCPMLTTSTVYDGLNRAVTVTAPATTDRVTSNTHQAQTTTVYDVDGNQVSQTIADVGSTKPDTARTSVNHYDGHDRVDWSMDAQQTADGNGTSTSPDLTKATQYHYGDPYGNKTQVVSPQDQNGRSTITDYQYDADGRLLYTTLEGYTGSPSGSQSAANQVLEARTYDPAGRLASVTDAMGFATFYRYYDDNLTATVTRCQASVMPAGVAPICTGPSFVQESDSYDGAGDLTASVTNNGTTETDYAYDAAARQSSSTLDPHGLNRTTTKTYNADDLVVSQRTGDAYGSGTTDYQYNADGAMTAQSVEDYTTGAPSGWWKLNDGAAGASTPSTAHDWSGQNNPGTLNSGVSWASGAASFNGTTGSIATSATPINTAAGYSVSAWVNFAVTPTSYSTIVGTPGTHNGAFYLQYSSASGGWAFVTTSADAAGETQYASTVSATPTAGTWYHLVGVHDAQLGTIQLYVDAAAAPAATQTAAWSAAQGLSIGSAGAGGNYVNGQVANVQVYPRALTQTEVNTLYDSGNGRTEGALSASSNTTTWALDGRDLPVSMTDGDGNVTNYVYDEAGRRAVTEQPTVTTGTYSASGGYTTATTVPTTTTGYDTFGDAVETLDTGIETITSFDADSRPTKTTLPDYQQPGNAPNNQLLSGETSRTQYNELGQSIETWDPTQVATTYAYDQLGHATTQTQDPGGVNQATTTTAYDLDGDATQVTDPAGNIQAATYDYLGRTVTTTQVLGLGGSGSTQLPADKTDCTLNNTGTQASCTTTYSYTDPAGFLSRVTSPSGTQSVQYGYDAAGERTSVTDGVNQTTTTAYDYAGRPVKTTLPDGTYSTTTYDQAGQVTAQAQYDGSNNLLRSSSASYDADGNTLSTTDPNGNTTHYVYDQAGWLTSESQPASYTSTLTQVPSVTQTITTAFGYDAAGRQTEYITGNGNAWYTTYNSWGLPESSIAPPTATYTTAADSTTTVTYDPDGRAVEQDAPGGVVQTQGYDHLGEVTSQSGSSTNPADAPTATRTFTYYPSGLIKTASTSNTATSGSNATSETFTYDDSGALASTAGSAGTSTFGYTADGQLASRADTLGGTAYTTGYSYDGAGRLQTITEPLTGQTLTYAYTPNKLDYTITYSTGGDVRSFQYNTAHELATDTLSTATGGTVASISYGYDPNGNETSKTTAGFTGAAANTYTYDQADRLKSWSNATTVTGYGYDQDGNRTNVAGNTYTYDARDELTSDGTNNYTYTARGTLQSTASATGTVTTTTDAYNQQTTAGTTSYTYDALERVTAVGAAAMAYSGLGNQIVSDTAGALYTRDPAGTLIGVKVSASTNPTLAYTDQHTDLVARFKPADGALTASTAYDPLGNILATAGNQVALGYQSEYTNAGKANMAARWYNPATGQFTSKDTTTNNPVPDSANANPFAYANDNPLTATDPTGHRACGDVGQCFGTTSAEFRSGVAEAKSNATYWSIVIRHLIYVKQTLLTAAYGSLRPWDGKQLQIHLPSPATVAPDVPAMPDPVPQASPTPDLNETGSLFDLFNALVSGGAGLLTGLLCEGATDGAGSELCNAAAGGAAGFVNQGLSCIEHGGKDCSAAAFLAATSSGAAAGLAFAPGGSKASDAISEELAGSAAPKVDSALSDELSNVGSWSDGSVQQLSAGLDDEVKSLGDLVSDDETIIAGGGSNDSAADVGKAPTSSAASKGTPTTPRGGKGPGDYNATTQAKTPVLRDVSAVRAEPNTAEPAVGPPATSPCSAPHSFTGSTPVLMADGTTKPIDQIKVGDEITNAAPGGANETHTVDKVIVTTTDHDFAALTITPVQPTTTGASAAASLVGNGLNTGTRTKIAVAALAAALLLPPASGAGAHQVAGPHSALASAANLTTTYHHQFYDATTNQWTQAENLQPGDLLQTPTGYALLDAVHLYHANTVTYDLTIGDLHTYYVVAGNTPVLVHNIDNPCKSVVLYRSPGTGNRASEANGLNAANHSGDHPTAYLSNLPEGAAHYAGNGHDLGMHVFTMKPGFQEAFGDLEFPLENSMGLTEGLTEWRIPASRFDEFNSYIDQDLTEWWDAADGHFFPPPGSIHSP